MGLVLRLQTGQDEMQDAISKLKSELTTVRKDMWKSGEDLRDMVDNLKAASAGSSHASDGSEYQELKASLKRLTESALTLGDVDRLFFPLLAAPGATSSPNNGGDGTQNPEGGELALFAERIQKRLALLQESKAEKGELETLHSKLYSQITKKYDEANKKRDWDVDTKVEGVTSELSLCKEAIEKLEDELKQYMSNSGGYSKEEIELKLRGVLLNMEGQIHAVINSNIFKSINTKLEQLEKQLSDTPSEKDIEKMLNDLSMSVNSQLGDSRTFQILIENMKLDLRRKVTKTEVMSFVRSSIEDVRERLQPPDDALMIGRSPLRCICCNQQYPTMHSSPAKFLPHRSLNPVSATLADRTHLPHLVENTVVLATYPHGRSGALRPMGLQSTPGVPLLNAGGVASRGGMGSRGGGTGKSSRGTPTASSPTSH